MTNEFGHIDRGLLRTLIRNAQDWAHRSSECRDGHKLLVYARGTAKLKLPEGTCFNINECESSIREQIGAIVPSLAFAVLYSQTLGLALLIDSRNEIGEKALIRAIGEPAVETFPYDHHTDFNWPKPCVISITNEITPPYGKDVVAAFKHAGLAIVDQDALHRAAKHPDIQKAVSAIVLKFKPRPL